MTYHVTLSTDGEQDQSAVFLASNDRPAVSQTVQELERKLSIDPLSAGESRESSVSRLDFVGPLGFTFDVVVDDAMVFVTAIWLVS